MARKQNKSQLTEVELELMNIIWKLKEASVSDVLKELPKTRNMAYTSASTIIRILEKKSFVKSRKEGKTHFYSPMIDKAEYESRSLNHLVEKLFDDGPVSMVARLLGDEKVSKQELEAIRKMLDEKLKS